MQQKVMKSLILLALLVMIMVVTVGCSLAASSWKPTGAVEIVVPYAAGGSSDLLGRAVEKIWPKYCDQPVRVTAMPGGGGVTGSMYVANAKPDGKTLVLAYGSGCDMSMPYLQQMDYDPFKYLDPIVRLSVHNVVIAALPDSGFTSLADVIQWSKDSGKPITVSSSTANGTVDLVNQALKYYTGMNMNIVPHAGTAESIADILSGAYVIAGAHPSDVLPFSQAGQVKLLGVAADVRDSALPDVPTLIEQGINFWAYGSIKGIAVPKNTPDEIKAYYEKLFADIASDSEFIKIMNNMGQPVMYQNIADFTKYFTEANATYKKLIEDLGLAYYKK